VTLYDVLHRLIARSAMGEVEQKDCQKVIDDLEAVSGLGTTTGHLEAQSHECVFYGHPSLCIYCGKAPER